MDSEKKYLQYLNDIWKMVDNEFPGLNRELKMEYFHKLAKPYFYWSQEEQKNHENGNLEDLMEEYDLEKDTEGNLKIKKYIDPTEFRRLREKLEENNYEFINGMKMFRLRK